jgi:sugar phosphate permease
MKNKERITTILLVILCMCFQTLALNGIALFLPEIRKELGLSFTEGGAISAASLFIYAAMQIPSGYLADRYGSRRIFFIGALGTTVFCMAFGFISNYWQGVTTQALSGFFRSLLFVPSMALLAGWFSPNRRATAMGLSQSGIFMGQVFINGLGPSLASEYGWRFPFITFAAAGILFTLAFFLFGRESPSVTRQQNIKFSEIIGIFRHRLMWVFGIIHFLRLGMFQGVTLWLPSLLINDKGMELQIIGFIMAARAIIVTPSNVIGGFISDKSGRPIMVMGISLVIMAITTVLLVQVNDFTMLMIIIAINALFVQFYSGPLFSMPVDLYGKHITGVITGVSNLFANLGSVTFVYLLGWLKDTTGTFHSGFYAMAGSCIIGIFFTIILARARQKPGNRAESENSP